jgi:formylglycine-generating enzyme required for sulfatase activity
MRLLQPGIFRMESPNDKRGRYPDEGPIHDVRLMQSFWLAETPCTQALRQAVIGKNPRNFIGLARPTERVSYNDAGSLLRNLND